MSLEYGNARIAGARSRLLDRTTIGRLADSEREVLVLVLADDPRVGKYGGDVAGPAAVAILREALGQTRDGLEPVPDLVEGFGPSKLVPQAAESGAQPWAEVGW